MTRRLLERWYWIVVGGLVGALLAAAYSMTLPDEYAPVARLVLEPRGLQVLPDSVAPRGLNNEATIAYSQSQVDIIRSSSVLNRVIENEGLLNDPEFTSSDPLLKRIGLDALHYQLFGLDRMADPVRLRAQVLEEVRKRLYVGRLNQSFVIEVGFASRSPAKAARITNAIARSYLVQAAGVQNDAARSATADLTARLAELRTKVASSEQLIEAHKRAFNLVETNGRLVDEDRLARLNDQLSNATALTAEARSRVVLAREVDVDDVIGGGLPAALSSTTIPQLRVAYAQAKSRGDRLAVKLGERHPRRREAAAELSSAETAIREEITRLVASTEREFTRAQGREKDLAEQVAELRAQTLDNNGAKAKLRELERQRDADQRVYETVLRRSRETGEQTQITRADARIITEALPPKEKSGPPRRVITMAGGAMGGGTAAFLLLLPMFWRAGRDFAFAPPVQRVEPAQGPMQTAPAAATATATEPAKRKRRKRRKSGKAQPEAKVVTPEAKAATPEGVKPDAKASDEKAADDKVEAPKPKPVDPEERAAREAVERMTRENERLRREAEEREAVWRSERDALAKERDRERERLREQEAAARRAAEEHATRAEADRAAAERAARMEAEREAEERLARMEAERAAAERAARMEAEREAEERVARMEAERQAAEQAAREEMERAAEAERAEFHRRMEAQAEAARAERDAKQRAAILATERERAERERAEREAEAAALAERARLEIEERLRERERELQAREAEAAERAELARRAQAEAEHRFEALRRLEAERAEATQAELERLAEARAETQRMAAERAQTDRMTAERAEAMRLEVERLAAERAQIEREAAERAEALEREAQAMHREAERLAAQRAVAERAEAERMAAERAEIDRLRAAARPAYPSAAYPPRHYTAEAYAPAAYATAYPPEYGADRYRTERRPDSLGDPYGRGWEMPQPSGGTSSQPGEPAHGSPSVTPTSTRSPRFDPLIWPER